MYDMKLYYYITDCLYLMFNSFDSFLSRHRHYIMYSLVTKYLLYYWPLGDIVSNIKQDIQEAAIRL
jgi:hypothetical protein